MFDFIGTFVDGPLAGQSFGAVMGDGGDGGGGLLGAFLLLGGFAAVLGIVGYVLLYIFVAPFATWFLMFKDESIIAITIFLLIELVYMIFRVRSNVKHWDVSFIKEVIYNTIYFIVLYLICVGILIIPFIFITEGAYYGNYLLSHYGQWLYEVFFSQIIGFLFFFIPLSILPALMTTGVTYLLLGKILKIAKLKTSSN